MVTPSPPPLICVSAAHVSEATSLAYPSSVNQLPVLDPLPSQDSAALSAQVFYTSVPLFPKLVPFIYTYCTAQDNGLDSNSCRVYSAAAIQWKLLLKDNRNKKMLSAKFQFHSIGWKISVFPVKPPGNANVSPSPIVC